MPSPGVELSYDGAMTSMRSQMSTTGASFSEVVPGFLCAAVGVLIDERDLLGSWKKTAT